ncbi:sugar ABC transporter ATP-binding protein [Pacificoceanicola onchidii]|uniref:sugar ABC transporter ATP-binding protein n=1 Tax=Pacificoceanicola onchidii TaxID=2562685 RepID=UPI0010A56C59|nr:sugar ABC transporter ATP-binding protein [Pacificoceanicola onchidii]
MAQPYLAARGLNKSFGPNEVLKGIEFEVHGGHAVALCGENGAGKSTLIKLLTGLYTPTGGHVEFEGQPARWTDPRQSLAAGIAVVHQEFSVLGALSIAENIYLGAEPRTRLGLIDRKALTADAQALLDELGITLDPNALVETLSVADKQMVEIAKALRSEAKVLILDEPTAVLSQNETRHLFRIINDLRAKGLGLVYVSHRLDEIFEICTDITVIKDGVVTSKGPTADYTHDSVVAAMVGRELGDLFPAKAATPTAGEAVLEVRDLVVASGLPPATLQVHAGEIVGLAGLVGSGRTELARALYAGEAVSGDVSLMGEPMPHRDPAGSIEAGMLMLTESRKDDGLFLNSSVARNFSATTPGLGAHHNAIPPGHEERRASVLKERRGVVVDHVGLPISALSGGNQQKVLVARLLENRPKLLILDEPTRGVDVGAKADIYKALRQLADDGMALLVISSELIEIVGLADRVLVMRDGEIAKELRGEDITEAAIITVAAAETASHHGVAA